MPTPSETGVVKLRIRLDNVKPAITRDVYFSAEAMGWYNAHMHHVWTSTNYGSKRTYYEPAAYHEMELGHGQAYDNINILEFFPERGSTLKLEYDFGDGWVHTIKRMADPTWGPELLPALVAAKNACPPEDIGGPHTFMEIMTILEKDGLPGLRRQEYEDHIDWWVEDFDREDSELEGLQDIVEALALGEDL